MEFHNMVQQNRLDVTNYVEAEEFLNAYFAKFPEIKTYMDANN